MIETNLYEMVEKYYTVDSKRKIKIVYGVTNSAIIYWYIIN